MQNIYHYLILSDKVEFLPQFHPFKEDKEVKK